MEERKDCSGNLNAANATRLAYRISVSAVLKCDRSSKFRFETETISFDFALQLPVPRHANKAMNEYCAENSGMMLISSELSMDDLVIMGISINFCMGNGINMVRMRFARCLTTSIKQYVLALDLPGE